MRISDWSSDVCSSDLVSRPIQGKGGTLQGLEAGAKLAFSDVVPNAGFLRNFGIDANYTFSDSSQERRGLDGKKLPLQDNSKHQINFALWYQDSHFKERVAYNYSKIGIAPGRERGCPYV